MSKHIGNTDPGFSSHLRLREIIALGASALALAVAGTWKIAEKSGEGAMPVEPAPTEAQPTITPPVTHVDVHQPANQTITITRHQ